MEKRKARKKCTTDSPSLRDWAGLPPLIVETMVDHLTTLAGFLSFRAVCRPWRLYSDHFVRSDYLASRPPFLLACSPDRGTAQITDVLTCSIADKRMQCLDGKHCVGCSFGHLVIFDDDTFKILLVDVFTGKTVTTPTLRSPEKIFIPTYGALTSPPSSNECRLLLFDMHDMCYWQLGDAEWRYQQDLPYVSHVMGFQGKIYAVCDRRGILVLEFDPELRVEELTTGGLSLPWSLLMDPEGPKLVECRGELMLVGILRRQLGSSDGEVKIHRLDLERGEWVEVTSLGDCSLFIDRMGSCHAAVCEGRAKWGGGRSNCVYVARANSSSWGLFCLDDGVTMENSRYTLPHRCWPSPPQHWVYPALFYRA